MKLIDVLIVSIGYTKLHCINLVQTSDPIINLSIKTQLMSSTAMQSRVIRVRVQIKRVAMAIKFPCSLAFQLRCENRVYDGGRLYQLRNNDCVVNDLLEGDFECTFSTAKQRYEEKKVQLQVSIVSATGRVSAGSTSLSLFIKQIGSSCETIQLLDKCPDRQAKIYLSYNCQFMKAGTQLNKTYINELKNLGSGSTGTARNYAKLQQQTQRSMEAGKHKKAYKSIGNQDRMMYSYVEEIIQTGAKKGKQQSTYDLETVGKKKIGISSQPQSHEPLSMQSKKQKAYQHPAYTNPRDKIKYAQQTPERFEIEDDIFTNRFKDGRASEEDGERWRQKIRSFERKEKELVSSLRQIRQDLQRKKSKIVILQNQREQTQVILQQKDSKIRYFQKQYKTLQQKLQDTASQLKTTKFHLQLKQTSHKQQCKKLQDRYRTAENERERINSQCQRILRQLQDMQRKYAGNIKQKQKQFTQERMKLNKRIQHMGQQIQRITSQLSEFHGEAAELAQQNKLLERNQSQSEMLLINHQSNCQMLQSSLRKELDMRKMLEKELEQMKLTENQKFSMKKKNNQLSMHLASVIQKSTRAQKLAQQFQLQIKSKQAEIQKRNQEKAQINNKYFQLKKSYQTIKCEEQLKLKQIESLTLQNINLTAKVQEFKQKWDSEKKYGQQLLSDFESRWQQAQQIKQQYEAELEEVNWRADRNENNFIQLEKEHNKLIDQNYKLGQQLFQKNEKLKRVEETLKGLQGQVGSGQFALNECESRKKQMAIQLKECKQEVQQQKKKYQKAEADYQHIKDRLKQFENTFKQRSLQWDKRVKELELQIHSKSESISTLQVQLLSKNETLSQQKTMLSQRESEISHLREINITIKKDMESFQHGATRYRENQNQLKDKLEICEKEREKYYNQTISLSVLLQKAQQSYNEYKTECYRAFQILHSELTRQEQSLIFPSNSIPAFSSQSQLNTRISFFPDARISRLQMEIIVRRNQNLARWRSRMHHQSSEKQHLQLELAKLRKKMTELQTAQQIQITKEKQRNRLLASEMASQAALLQEQINRYEEQLIEKGKIIDGINCQLLKLKDIYDEQSQQLKYLHQDHLSCSSIIQELQHKLSNQIEERKFMKRAPEQIGHEQSYSKVQYQQIIKMKESFTLAQRKIVQKERQGADRLEEIRKMTFQMDRMAYQKSRNEQIVQQLQEKLKQNQIEMQKLHKQLKEKEKDLKKQSDALASSLLAQSQLQGKFDQANRRLRQSSMEVLDLERHNARIKQELEACEEKIKHTEEDEKRKRQGWKTEKDRLMESITALKDKHLSLNSEHDMALFLNKQQDQQLRSLQDQLNDATRELADRRGEINFFKQEGEAQKRKYQELWQDFNNSEMQKKDVQSAFDKSKREIATLKISMRDYSQLQSELEFKQQEIQKLQMEKNQDNFYSRQSKNSNHSNHSSHNTKEQFPPQKQQQYKKQTKKKQEEFREKQKQYKKKIHALQELLQQQNHDLAVERKRLQNEFETERKQFQFQIQKLSSDRSESELEIESLKMKHQRQLEQMKHRHQELKEELSTKEFLSNNQQMEIDRLRSQIGQDILEKENHH